MTAREKQLDSKEASTDALHLKGGDHAKALNEILEHSRAAHANGGQRSENNYWSHFASTAAREHLKGVQIHYKEGNVSTIDIDGKSIYDRSLAVKKQVQDYSGSISNSHEGPYAAFRKQGLSNTEAMDAATQVLKVTGRKYFYEGEKFKINENGSVTTSTESKGVITERTYAADHSMQTRMTNKDSGSFTEVTKDKDKNIVETRSKDEDHDTEKTYDAQGKLLKQVERDEDGNLKHVGHETESGSKPVDVVSHRGFVLDNSDGVALAPKQVDLPEIGKITAQKSDVETDLVTGNLTKTYEVGGEKPIRYVQKTDATGKPLKGSDGKEIPITATFIDKNGNPRSEKMVVGLPGAETEGYHVDVTQISTRKDNYGGVESTYRLADGTNLIQTKNADGSSFTRPEKANDNLQAYIYDGKDLLAKNVASIRTSSPELGESGLGTRRRFLMPQQWHRENTFVMRDGGRSQSTDYLPEDDGHWRYVKNSYVDNASR